MTKLEFTPAAESALLYNTKQNINNIMNEYAVILDGVMHSDEMIDAVDQLKVYLDEFSVYASNDDLQQTYEQLYSELDKIYESALLYACLGIDPVS